MDEVEAYASITLCYSASLLLTPARASPSATRFARGIRVKTSMSGCGEGEFLTQRSIEAEGQRSGEVERLVGEGF